ncbi:branched-chain amino acid transaminase [Candidatus Peregrinibacteria bacterium]|nr:branched-chain amino acid transaminase [Candidatus Peregrinibacteria bacterium]
MEKVPFIWMDGHLVKWDEAKVHVLTHSLHYGSGVFEGIRWYDTKKGPAIFRLKDHLERLYFSAQVMSMKIPYTKKELEDTAHLLIVKNNIKEGYLRPLAYFGYGKMGLMPIGAPVNVALAVWPWGAYLGHDMVRVKISKFMRIHPKSSEMKAKICGHYANSILASLEARKAKCDEALLLDFEGNVAEGPGENIFMVQGGEIYTPKEGSILPGITRDSIQKFAKKLKIGFHEKKISVKDLMKADELFFTGTAAEITGISHVDGKRIADGKMGSVTRQLRRLYLDVVHGRVKEYEKWLEYCHCEVANS